MSFRATKKTIVQVAVSSFGSSVQLPIAEQYLVVNGTAAYGWFTIRQDQAEADAMTVPTSGTPSFAVQIPPASWAVFSTPAHGSLPWFNSCTPGNTSGTFSATGGNGE